MAVEDSEIISLRIMRLCQPTCTSSLWSLFPIDEVLNNLDPDTMNSLCNFQQIKKKKPDECGDDFWKDEKNKNCEISKQFNFSDSFKEFKEINNRINNKSIGFINDFRTSLTINNFHNLLLPVSQGQIYNGENFNAYINLSNISGITLTNLSITIELQIDGKCFMLFDGTENPIDNFAPLNIFDFSVFHHLEIAGIYTLVCSIIYRVPDADGIHNVKSLYKAYKFSVIPAFKLSHRIFHLKDSSLVEFNLKNVSSQSILLLDFDIKCIEGVNREILSLNEDSEIGSGDFLFSVQEKSKNFLKVNDSCNLVFSFKLLDSQFSNLLSIKDLDCFGMAHLNWRTSSGGSNYLENYEIINNKPMDRPPLDLHVINCPSIVQLCKPFEIEFEVVNRSSRNICAVILYDFDIMQPISTEGSTKRPIGSLSAQSCLKFSETFLSLSTGLQQVKGIVAVEDLPCEFIGIPEVPSTRVPICEIFVKYGEE